MSPKNKIKLVLLRKKLDKLDNQFLSLIKIRTSLVNNVIKLKQHKKDRGRGLGGHPRTTWDLAGHPRGP